MYYSYSSCHWVYLLSLGSRCDLAELHIKLKNYERAERVLNAGLERGEGTCVLCISHYMIVTV